MKYGKLKYTVFSNKDEETYSHEWKFSLCSENIREAYRRICDLILTYSENPDAQMSYTFYIWDTEAWKCEVLAQGDVFAKGIE